MTWIDIGVILLTLVFLSYGFKRGFMLEISDIAGIILSFFLAAYFPIHFGSRILSYLLSFVIYFVVLHIIFLIIAKVVRHTPLVFFDKILGIVIGAVKGLIFSLSIVLIISLFPIRYKPFTNSLSYKIVSVFRPLVKRFFKVDNIKKIKKIHIPSSKTI